MNLASVVAAIVLLASVLLLSAGCATRSLEKRYPVVGEIAEVDGEVLHFVDIGPEDSPLPPVILIHGASVNLRDMNMALGERLAETRRVLIVDRPGRGYSSRPRDGWRLSRQSALIHMLAIQRGIERPIVVGQSFGGAVSLDYALQYQDTLSGLVLLAAVSHEWPGGVAWYNSISGIPVAGTLLRRLVIPLYGPRAARAGVPASFAPDAPPPDYADRAGLALLFRPRDFASNAEDIRRLKPQIIDMQSRYSELRLPMAILTGESDRTVSPELHSKALAAVAGHAVYETYPNTGHALHHSQAARIIAVIDALPTKQAR